MSAQKRKAEDDLKNEQRLTKRFDLLNLDRNGKLYVPVQQASQTPRPPRIHSNEESMQIDDTKDRVYIHNLDDELSDIETEEERLVFLPDIEKKLGRIPKSVLLGEGHPSTSNQMVLYSVPTSLSVPEEQDSVRKAILESRARAREKQVQNTEGTDMVEDSPHDGLNYSANIEQEDDDAMDLG